MFKLELSDEDRIYMRGWGISSEADTRTRAESEARFVAPEWLRRCTWRNFWMGQDNLRSTVESRSTANPPRAASLRPHRMSNLTENTVASGLTQAHVYGAGSKHCASGSSIPKENSAAELILLDDKIAGRCACAKRRADAVFFLILSLVMAGLCGFVWWHI